MTTKEKNNCVTQDKTVIEKIVCNLTLFDDDLMSRVFDQNIEATELLLRIVLERNIKVTSVTGQDELKNPKVGGRDIILDVHALDENGEEMDVEVQTNSKGAHVKRARYHSSMVDSRMLKAGQDFQEIKDSYVIFIYKHDKFEKGLPIYHVDRYINELQEPFADGSHIIYVNGNYKGDDEIGRLMKDFHQVDPSKMHYSELARGVSHLKGTGGQENMCEAVQKYAEEYAKEYSTERTMIIVENFMKNMNFTLEQSLDAAGIQGEERELLIKHLQKKQ